MDESRLAVLADIVITSTRVLADRSRLHVQADIVTTSTRVLADGSRLAMFDACYNKYTLSSASIFPYGPQYRSR